jgi:hypothetical protein
MITLLTETTTTNAAIIWPQIAAIITAVGTIILGWFTYNQHSKNKMTDAKIENMKDEAEKKNEIRNEKMAKIYGVLWRILYETKADRVYIAQPHPLTNALYLSVGLEVKRKGLAKNAIEDTLSLSEVANFAAELSRREFMLYIDVVGEVRDNRAKALFYCNGTESAVIRRLHDNQDWVGSLFVEFTHKKTDLIPATLREMLAEAANEIQFDLPEYKGSGKWK